MNTYMISMIKLYEHKRGLVFSPPYICLFCIATIEGHMKYVTGYAKIGYVGADYTPSYNIPYLSNGIEYLYSVTGIIKPIKWVMNAKIFMAIT